MTTPQIISISIIAAVIGLMVWGRWRYDIVAGLGLLAGVATGIIPVKDAFKGFSDEIVIIVGSALVVSHGISRSSLFLSMLSRATPLMKSTQSQVIFLVTTVGVLSALVKNIGALAMLLPIAFQFARKNNKSASVFLMPMAFASLLGGIVTLVGTSPNVIVSRVRAELTGKPFTMFDYTPVGIFIALAGIAFLCVAYRIIPRDRRGATALSEALKIDHYVTEASIGEKSKLAGKHLSELLGRAQAGVTVVALLRGKTRHMALFPDTTLRPGDILILRGESEQLAHLVKEADLTLEGKDRLEQDEEREGDDIISVEVVVSPGSPLIGSAARLAGLYHTYGINLVAVGRSGAKLTGRLRDIRLQLGDVLVLQGAESTIPQHLSDLGLLPLAERSLMFGDTTPGWIALAILAVTMTSLALGLVPVALAFFAAAGGMILFGAVPVREAYDEIEWPILVMFAALIPVSDTLSTTGATGLIAEALSNAGRHLPAWGCVALVLSGAMAVTPFLNNAATVLVMAPIGATFAKNLGYNPDAFLMAVALGAACDFLTPIGHQCNTLVMGPGGYKFSDYPRLGAPLSLLVIVMGVPLIMFFWPLK